MAIRIEIPLKLPSCNEYINECRRNRYAGAKMKTETEEQIGIFIAPLPTFTSPVWIDFIWIESNRRRDLDGIAFGKKFILDALVKYGKLKDDNSQCVIGFSDSFDYGKETMVIIDITEAER